MRKQSSYSAPEKALTFSQVLERRREFVSGQLQEVCRETRNPKILSVANGAIREAEAAIEQCRLAGGAFVVLDGSGEPPDLFRLDSKRHFARYINYPYGAIPTKDNIGDFDYVYSLNLLSELNQRRAQTAVSSLVELIGPGGRLLVSNFTEEFGDIALGGFYRREEEMAQLVPDSGLHAILGHAIWRDESRGILYLEIQKLALMGRGGAPAGGFLH